MLFDQTNERFRESALVAQRVLIIATGLDSSRIEKTDFEELVSSIAEKISNAKDALTNVDQLSLAEFIKNLMGKNPDNFKEKIKSELADFFN